jgi:multisubunit Na+/H+ antiporter MnhE subunit
MPVLMIVFIVLVAWGAGAAAGTAWTYLAGALVGAVIFLVLVAFFGAISAWRHPSEREARLPL